MELAKLAITLDYIGTMLIAVAATSVHNKVLNEHKIDKKVYKSMKIESKLAIVGMFLITASFIINVTL